MLIFVCFPGCCKSNTRYLRCRHLRQDLPRILCSFWPSSRHTLPHLQPRLLHPPSITLLPPCLLSQHQWGSSTAPGNKPWKQTPPPPPPAALHPASPPQCPQWPLLLTFLRLICTLANNLTLTSSFSSRSSSSSLSLQHRPPSPFCQNLLFGAYLQTLAPLPTCRSW